MNIQGDFDMHRIYYVVLKVVLILIICLSLFFLIKQQETYNKELSTHNNIDIHINVSKKEEKVPVL